MAGLRTGVNVVRRRRILGAEPAGLSYLQYKVSSPPSKWFSRHGVHEILIE